MLRLAPGARLDARVGVRRLRPDGEGEMAPSIIVSPGLALSSLSVIANSAGLNSLRLGRAT
jgi:hypothetical protein